MTLVALLLVFGCGEVRQNVPAGPMSWDEFSSACDPGEGAGAYWPLTESGHLEGLSEDCRSVVVEAFGIEADTFDEETLEISVGGLLIATRSGEARVEELLSEGVPTELSDQLVQTRNSEALADDDIAGRLWYAILTDNILRVVHSPSNSDSDTLMSYDNGTVRVGKITVDSDGPPEPPALNPLEAASIFVHEASHGFLTAQHVPCGSGESSCDLDSGGAYGAGIWWTWTWIRPEYASGTTSLCVSGVNDIIYFCDNLLDPTGFPPCEEGASDVCE